MCKGEFFCGNLVGFTASLSLWLVMVWLVRFLIKLFGRMHIILEFSGSLIAIMTNFCRQMVHKYVKERFWWEFSGIHCLYTFLIWWEFSGNALPVCFFNLMGIQWNALPVYLLQASGARICKGEILVGIQWNSLPVYLLNLFMIWGLLC